MIRRILTPLDPSDYTKSALQYALYIAKRQNNAEIIGTAVLDMEGIEKSIGPVAAGALYWAEHLEKHKLEEAKERIERLLNMFRDACLKEGVPYKTTETQGNPAKQILFESIFYDLVVIGLRTYYHFETQPTHGDSLDKILEHTITPILAVPKNFAPIKKVLVAFDGSPLAARALQRFTHLARPGDFEFLIISSDEDINKAHYYLNQAKAYLKAYQIKNVRTEWTAENIQEVIRDRYLDWADLIVLGAHAHGFIKDIFVGSLTKYLIDKAEKPLFIGQ